MEDPYITDPYGEAMFHIVEALNNCLDDGVSGAMNSFEYHIMERIAFLINELDPKTGAKIDPRVA
jgi:hypothetical protein